MRRVAEREQATNIRDEFEDVRSQLAHAADALMDACDTVEKDLVGGLITKATSLLSSVTKE